MAIPRVYVLEVNSTCVSPPFPKTLLAEVMKEKLLPTHGYIAQSGQTPAAPLWHEMVQGF